MNEGSDGRREFDSLRGGGLVTGSDGVRRVRRCLDRFLSDVYADRNADGVILHLRGDINSTVVAAVAVEALGPDCVKGLVMPARLSDETATRHAEVVSEMLDIECRRLQLRPLLVSFQQVIGTNGEPADDIVALHGLHERFRTACLQYVGSATNSLVLGSSDRTTRRLRESAIHGRTDVDVAVLADLYRTEVRALARDLQLPEEIMTASDRGPPTGLSLDGDSTDLDPETVDRILHRRAEADTTLAAELDIDPETVREVRRRTAERRGALFRPHTASEWLKSRG